MQKTLNRLSHYADSISRLIALPFTASFFLIILYGVFARFVLQHPFIQAEEISRTSFVWACFLGTAVAYKARANISITVLCDRMPVKLRLYTELLMLLVGMAFYLFVLKYGIDITMKVAKTMMPASRISMAVMYSALPISMVFLLIHTLSDLSDRLHELLGKKGSEAR